MRLVVAADQNPIIGLQVAFLRQQEGDRPGNNQ
jgi:hypothetical protein